MAPSYRPHIDGLRALAVTAVIVYHMAEQLLPNGYLGVDVFFAISGFVITGSLLQQKERSLTQTYLRFFARRIKRLFPALFACVAVSSTALVWVDPMPEQSLTTAVFALFGFANIALYNFELDYFAAASRFNAFTHTWSLGVEEQFYMAFPLVLWLLWLRKEKQSMNVLIGVIAVLCVISMSGFILSHAEDTAAAYFLTPLRIWELGAGVLTYLLTRHSKSGLSLPAPVSIAAGAILVGLFFIPDVTSTLITPAVIALTATLLPLGSNTFVARLFSLKPVVYTGKLSYSLYLWHWPVLALAPMAFINAAPAPWLLAAVFVVLSILSYELLEQPLRYRRWSRPMSFGTALVALSILAGTGTLARSEENFFERHSMFPPAWPRLIPSGSSFPRHCVLEGERPQLSVERFDFCTLAPAPPGTAPTVWSMGDSHSAHLLAMLYELRAHTGVGTHLMLTPVMTFPPAKWSEGNPVVQIYREAQQRFKPGDILLLARLYFSRRNYLQPAGGLPAWFIEVGRIAADLEDSGINVVVFAPVPMFDIDDIRDCLNKSETRCAPDRAFHADRVSRITAPLRQLAAQHNNLFVFEPFEVLCPPDQEVCRPMGDRQYFYRDSDHLNSAGAAYLEPAFRAFLQSRQLLPPGQSHDPQ